MSLTQSEIKNAFVAALKEHGVATSADIENYNRDFQKNLRRDAQNKKREKSDGRGGAGSEDLGRGGSGAKDLKDQFKTAKDLLATPGSIIRTFDGTLSAMARDYQPFVDQLNTLQANYGGFRADSLKDSNDFSKSVLDNLKTMENFFHNIDDQGAAMAETFDQNTNYIYTHFKDAAEAFSETTAVTDKLITEHGTYVKSLDDATLYKLPAYRQAMGITHTQVAEIMEQEILRTGKATTNMLDNLAHYSVGLAEVVDVPPKLLMQNSVKIIKDTQRMGDITEEEATRMAATLARLGQDYESFGGTIEKFSEYGSASEAAAELSYLTGGQLMLDANELFQLAAESPEQFPLALAKMFQDAQFTIEDFNAMGLSRQRLFAEKLGAKSRDDVKKILRGSVDIASFQLEMDAKATELDNSGKERFDAVTDQLEESTKAADGVGTALDNLRTKAMLKYREDLILTARKQNIMNDRMNSSLQVSGKLETQFKNLISGYGDFVDGTGNFFQDTIFVDDLESLTGVVTKLQDKVTQLQNRTSSGGGGGKSKSSGDGKGGAGSTDLSGGKSKQSQIQKSVETLTLTAENVSFGNTPLETLVDISMVGLDNTSIESMYQISDSLAKKLSESSASRLESLITTIQENPGALDLENIGLSSATFSSLDDLTKKYSDVMIEKNKGLSDTEIETSTKLTEQLVEDIQNTYIEMQKSFEENKSEEYSKLLTQMEDFNKNITALKKTLEYNSSQPINVNVDGKRLVQVVSSNSFLDRNGQRVQTTTVRK